LQVTHCVPNGPWDGFGKSHPDVCPRLRQQTIADRGMRAVQVQNQKAHKRRLVFGHRFACEIDVAGKYPPQVRPDKKVLPKIAMERGQLKLIAHPSRLSFAAKSDAGKK
jgi:hypothetical protein